MRHAGKLVVVLRLRCRASPGVTAHYRNHEGHRANAHLNGQRVVNDLAGLRGESKEAGGSNAYGE